MRFILASASPRRRDLLEAAGFGFDVDPADVDETPLEGEAPVACARRLAEAKARVVGARHPGRLVLGADTVVILQGGGGDVVLGKPEGRADARAMLEALGGRVHEVVTAVALLSSAGVEVATDRTRVWMRALSPAEIEWYVASGEPMDKAGGYAIQGLASRFIPRIDGSYSNVVGLPMATVDALLARAENPAAGGSISPRIIG